MICWRQFRRQRSGEMQRGRFGGICRTPTTPTRGFVVLERYGRRTLLERLNRGDARLQINGVLTEAAINIGTLQF